jgi:hypothetical protein
MAPPSTCRGGILLARRICSPGHTVYSIVLEVPDSELLATAGGNRRVGIWALSSLATDAGGWRSINRVGPPMIHPFFTQFNEDLGNPLNGGRPADNFPTHGKTVAKAIAGVVAAYGTAERPKAMVKSSRTASAQRTSVRSWHAGGIRLRLNGRSLSDNAPDVMFSFADNTPVRLGIGKESVT